MGQNERPRSAAARPAGHQPKGSRVGPGRLAFTWDSPVLRLLARSGMGCEADGGPDALLARLDNPKTREATVADRAKTGHTFLPEATVIAAMPPGRSSSWAGSTIQDIAATTGRDPAEASLDVPRAHRAQVWIVNHAMSEADVDTVLRRPSSAVVSDGWELDSTTDGHPHPRHFGTFARVLARYTRDRQILDPQDAIRKMSALPAARLGLTDRGTPSEGTVADLADLRSPYGERHRHVRRTALLRRGHPPRSRQRPPGAARWHLHPTPPRQSAPQDGRVAVMSKGVGRLRRDCRRPPVASTPSAPLPHRGLKDHQQSHGMGTKAHLHHEEAGRDR